MKEKFKAYGLAAGLVIVIVGALSAVSWIATCGIIKLITMCFDLEFNWAIATGIWLAMILLKQVFGKTVNSKK